jgi:eukaryotic-like serine/threonine-protein kinase
MAEGDVRARQGAEPGSVPTLNERDALAKDLIGRGTIMGRYQIIEQLAVGGMGVVFRAHDPELSRPVAVKLVQQQSIDIEHLANVDEYERRLLREAQTLARLSHPNVVAAFDVGKFEGHLFIAMELIDGVSVSEWLAQEPRSLAEILRVLVAAGRGLSEAHRVGVVHRDFKLSNVMVSAHGRVQVVDFGLAHTPSSDVDGRHEESGYVLRRRVGEAHGSGSVHTRSGTVVGTPGYIAPEHFDGRPSDARSDQFSYAAAVFRALTGVSPYPAESLSAYRRALLQRQRTAWPRFVPRGVRRVVDRGLALEPDKRFRGLAELVDKLEQAAAPRHRRAALTAAGAAAAVALASLAVYHERRVPSCDLDVHSFDRAFGDERRAAVAAAFASSRNPRSAEALSFVTGYLDEYRGRWQEMKQEACRATYVSKEQPEPVLHLRNACLDLKLTQIDTLVGLFEQADSTLVDRSTAAVRDLAVLTDCADVATLMTESEELPDDPARRERIGALTAELASIDALTTVGRWQASLERAQTVLAEAERLGHAPTQARAMKEALFALQRLGRPQEADALMQRALKLAGDARVLDVASWLGMRLLIQEVNSEHFAQARTMLPLIDLLVRIEGNPALRRFRLLAYEAQILTSERQWDRAAETLQTALRDCHAMGSEGQPYCLTPQRALGLLYAARKDYRAAQRELEATVALAEQLLGPSHPQVVNEYNNLAVIMAEGRVLDVAERAIGRSKQLAAGLPPDRQMANIPAIEGRIWDARGDCARALPLYTTGLESVAAAYGAESGPATDGHFYLGRCLAKLGRRAEALPHLELAVERRRAARDATGSLAAALFELAQALAPQPHGRRRARALAEEALRAFRSEGGDSADAAASVERWLQRGGMAGASG